MLQLLSDDLTQDLVQFEMGSDFLVRHGTTTNKTFF
jgi:hypothetical protein